jgi:hypothetical protein
MKATRLAAALSLLLAHSGWAESLPQLRGMTVSAQTYGHEWATPEMASALDDLKAIGVNAVAIHPYAFIDNDGGLKWDTNPDPDYIAKPLAWARERGMTVMLVPHIAYWGTRFLWRGEIDFRTEAGWEHFFTHYEAWTLHMAAIAEKNGAEIFSVGLEYGPSQKFDARWRRIIRNVREVYKGKIVYGANWNEFENVPFWDALDYVGVLAYFPLSNSKTPTPQELAKAWQPWMTRLERTSKAAGRPVLFTEIGYNHSPITAAKPWDFHVNGGENAREIQTRCIETALTLPAQYPFLAGMFFWKYFPNVPSYHPETFDLREPSLKAVIKRHWAQAE